MKKESELQVLKLTRAAAMEAVARAMMDFEDWSKESAADVSRAIVAKLGFR